MVNKRENDYDPNEITLYHLKEATITIRKYKP